ncbi:AAA domain-containing protein [Plantactinospora sonchi]|uniref:AAA domain-containing protein n=1 Tax=Plantactinospora sonchi TaxID=1544735 RepID=A0ABU7RNP9_9ACTN
MTARAVVLPGPVAVIPSAKAAQKLAAQQRRAGVAGGHGDVTGLADVVAEIDRLSRAGSLPARVEGDDPQRLVVYTSRHMVSLYLTRRGDAYSLGHLAPLNFRDQERLLRAAVLVHCPAGWWAYHQVRDVPPGWSGHWASIARAWQAAAVTSAPSTLPPHHLAWLDLLTEVVEATRDIEIERQRTGRPVPYRRVTSAQEERHTARGVYAFHLLRPASELAVGAAVYLVDEPELRGRVKDLRDRQVVVRFDSAVDYRRIPPQGALQVQPSDRVYRAQLDAVDALRRREVVNPYLLAGLVDRWLQPYQPDHAATPRESLDPGQLAAFRRALTVPDQLLVLGPPGTGKTRTITEIAAACVARGQRVLVTSHTNRAVDNVLERLPAEVRAVRLGNEDAMTSEARGFMVENQVDALREEILAATEGPASRLAAFGGTDAPLARWQDFLVSQVAVATAKDAEVRAHTAALDTLVQRINAPLAAAMAAAVATVTRARDETRQVTGALETARQRHAAADARSRTGWSAFFFGWLAGRRWRQVRELEERLPRLRSALAEAESTRTALRAQVDAAVSRDPEAARLVAARDTAVEAARQAVGEAARAAAMLRDALRPVVPLPAGPPAGPADGTPVDPAGWSGYAEALGHAVGLARRRAALLDEWRARVRQPGEDLHRETVRYADVVAATCIGTATTPLLAGLDFDLAIVDEAGQISTPNLLVPLVRARRSVLVGDHHQLPPFLDDEVKGWTESLARSADVPAGKAEEIGDLLRRSAFERLYQDAGDGHRVMLTVQRRMPETLARFVSRAFYSDVLETEHPGGHHDPIFAQPFAMVDTSDQAAAVRAERAGRNGEEWGRRGYVNDLEARIVTDLVTAYVHHYPDWAVIVPYRAQVDQLVELLAKSLGDAAGVADRVGTVDSFQGGERDLVVYGFTRSNSRGEVGFLRELRRINVALTRARRQLVVVGDASTLRAARDEPFAELFRAMVEHLGHSGDLRRSRDVSDLLAKLARERG